MPAIATGLSGKMIGSNFEKEMPAFNDSCTCPTFAPVFTNVFFQDWLPAFADD